MAGSRALPVRRRPAGRGRQIRATAPLVTYGWGLIPVEGLVGRTRFTTSLFPKDGGYLVPLKDKVRAAEGIALGDTVTILLTLDI